MPASADAFASHGDHLSRIGAFLRHELRPYPGRTAAVVRTMIACIITMLLVMMFQLPNGFLAVFYAVAISRAAPHATVRNGFNIILGNAAGLALAAAGMILFLDHHLLHFLFIIAVCFLAFFLARTLTNYATAFGFGLILIAATSVNIIWMRPGHSAPDVGTAIWTAFGIFLGSAATVLTEWLFTLRGHLPNEPAPPQPMFAADAFSNPEYVSFALKGCLAAAICYVFWSATDWPGLGVCTVTCLIAAPLGTPGTPQQRFLTRLTGLLIGGVVCGIGSQVFILPRIDSIVGFTLAFAIVSAIAAWFVMSSPQFNYFGRQMALAYYLTIFQNFGPNASLTESRDRLLGILLGLTVMWLVFDAASSRQATARLAA
ncbi:MAG TPA: FUSC family protein [Bryobacteraceae bacterium]|nr:FUSC family protein [Bryobacteraceae bacterium]